MKGEKIRKEVRMKDRPQEIKETFLLPRQTGK
jgi:hypothetical protein